jgi:hypothetical protein
MTDIYWARLVFEVLHTTTIAVTCYSKATNRPGIGGSAREYVFLLYGYH